MNTLTNEKEFLKLLFDYKSQGFQKIDNTACGSYAYNENESSDFFEEVALRGDYITHAYIKKTDGSYEGEIIRYKE